MAKLRYLDLFAGAGGLSEGFIRAGFTPVSHVEMDAAACYTLKTRLAYKWLLNEGKSDIYDSYLRGEITRNAFYAEVPESLLSTVLNYHLFFGILPQCYPMIFHNSAR